MCCEEYRLHANKHAIHELQVSYTGTSDAVTHFQTHTNTPQTVTLILSVSASFKHNYQLATD